MSKKTVQYFFSFLSPYAALADSRIDDLIAAAGAELDPIPVVPPPSDPPQGLAAQILEFKTSYMLEDCARWARKLGLPWKAPDGRVDVTDASAGYFFARDRGKERPYRRAVFGARWAEGRDVSDQRVLSACAAQAGLDPEELAEALRSKRYHDDVGKALMRCLDNQVFGVPIFVAGGKRFWGNDRIDFLLEELRGGS